MQVRRFERMLDMVLALMLFWLFVQRIDIPYPRTPAGFWELRAELFRVATAVLWLSGIWLHTFVTLGRAKRMSGAALLPGAALVLGVLATDYVTWLIIISNRAKLSQEIYGAVLLATCAAAWGLHLALERVNGDAPGFLAASARLRRAFAAAFAILALGMAVCALRYGPAMRYSAAVAAACLWATWIRQNAGPGRRAAADEPPDAAE